MVPFSGGNLFEDLLDSGPGVSTTTFATNNGGTVHITRTVIGDDGSVRREMRFRLVYFLNMTFCLAVSVHHIQNTSLFVPDPQAPEALRVDHGEPPQIQHQTHTTSMTPQDTSRQLPHQSRTQLLRQEQDLSQPPEQRRSTPAAAVPITPRGHGTTSHPGLGATRPERLTSAEGARSPEVNRTEPRREQRRRPSGSLRLTRRAVATKAHLLLLPPGLPRQKPQQNRGRLAPLATCSPLPPAALGGLWAWETHIRLRRQMA